MISPPLSERNHFGDPMSFMSATNFFTNVVVSDLLLVLYGRIHLKAMSTNIIN